MFYEYRWIHTSIGDLCLVADGKTLCRIFFSENQLLYWAREKKLKENPSHPIIQLGKEQIEEYLAGKRKQFHIPFAINEGTDFQKTVWRALMNIPYGETVSYLHIATSIGNEKAVRAVGQANRKNPLPVIIPCHRVIGKNGSLTGYAGDRIEIKEKLLDLEKNVLEKSPEDVHSEKTVEIR